MELALAELAQLELALRAANQKERAGRSLVAASASSGEIADRIAGMEESRDVYKRQRNGRIAWPADGEGRKSSGRGWRRDSAAAH